MRGDCRCRRHYPWAQRRPAPRRASRSCHRPYSLAPAWAACHCPASPSAPGRCRPPPHPPPRSAAGRCPWHRLRRAMRRSRPARARAVPHCHWPVRPPWPRAQMCAGRSAAGSAAARRRLRAATRGIRRGRSASRAPRSSQACHPRSTRSRSRRYSPGRAQRRHSSFWPFWRSPLTEASQDRRCHPRARPSDAAAGRCCAGSIHPTS
mmetsp:Transcript_16379/g.38948  ORF Transcript_16379/g.38948 Transcript_16379/m.38948 type:complete len:207 (+) Transcript_16379:1854-2474(+)